MISIRKNIAAAIHDTPIYNIYRAVQEQREVRRWNTRGRPSPPPHMIKRNTLLAYQQKHGIRVLVETGTFQGDMIYAMRNVFSRIISIELDHGLHTSAFRRFSKMKHVEVLWGNSSELLPAVLESIDEPALFWLDGHYSGPGTARGAEDTPILRELSCVLKDISRNHVVLIDDAREFTGCDGYPTIGRLAEITLRLNPGASVRIADDIIRIAQ